MTEPTTQKPASASPAAGVMRTHYAIQYSDDEGGIWKDDVRMMPPDMLDLLMEHLHRLRDDVVGKKLPKGRLYRIVERTEREYA